MDIKTFGEVRTVPIVRRFDAYSASQVDETLRNLIDKGTRKIICDFSGCDYIASAGLRVVLSAAKRLQKLDGSIVLCSLKDHVREVFEIAGFVQLFTIFGTAEEALKGIK